MKNILVTGGAGFIGTNLIKRLLSEGHKVLSIDNYSTGKRENEQNNCKYYDIDINNKSIVDREEFQNIDAIFHLAALARIQPSLKKPQKSIETNVNGVLNTLELARKYNIPFIYAGSSSKHHGLWGSPYAWSKYAGEQLCELYSKVYNLNTSICRFYNVYGPHQLETGEYSTVLGIFERQYRNNNPLTITGDGEQRRDFTHVDDIVDGLIKISNTDHKQEDAWELGTGNNHSINEVYQMFKNKFGVDCVYIPDQKGNYRVTLRERDDALDLLNWKPKDRLKNYIENL